MYSLYLIYILQERKLLIEQVSQAQKLQTEAEKEADAAMTQLEEFINEQEKLVGNKIVFPFILLTVPSPLLRNFFKDFMLKFSQTV